MHACVCSKSIIGLRRVTKTILAEGVERATTMERTGFILCIRVAKNRFRWDCFVVSVARSVMSSFACLAEELFT